MTTILEQAASLLKLPSADYASFGEEQQLDLQEKLAGLARASATADRNVNIFALGAPAEANLDQNLKVPVLVGSSRTTLRNWQVNFKTNLNLFVRNLASGELRVVQPLVNVRRGIKPRPSGQGTPPKESEATNRTSSVTHVELERLNPGLHVVTALSQEVRSNTVMINVKGAIAAVRDEGRTVPPYIQHTMMQSADLPTRIEPRNAVAGSVPGLLGIAIQVRASDGVIKTSAEQSVWQSNLILVQIDETPIIIPIYVPVQEVTASDGKPAFNAVFAIDLSKTRNSLNSSSFGGSYQIYLDMGQTFLGPFPFRK